MVKNQTNAVAIDYDWKTNCIFWSDVTSRGSSILKSCNLTQTGNQIPGTEPEPAIRHLATLQNPDGLAIGRLNFLAAGRSPRSSRNHFLSLSSPPPISHLKMCHR